MMMRICREEKNTNNNSSLSLPPFHDDFSHAFHRTPCLHNHPSCCCPSLLPPLPPPPPPPATGMISGSKCSGEGFSFVDNMDSGLISCTECLGFESSDEISTLNFATNVDDPSSSSSPYRFFSSSPSPTPVKKLWPENRWEKKQFPPPLTTMSQNGRRSFILKPNREDGRLEIVKVEIERPEFLHASRQNGRLTLHLVKIIPQFNQVEKETPETETAEKEERESAAVADVEERENTVANEVEERYLTAEAEQRGMTAVADVRECTAAAEVEEREMTEAAAGEEEEREWRIPAAGVRRCYHYNRHAWGQQQRRWVTTIM